MYSDTRAGFTIGLGWAAALGPPTDRASPPNKLKQKQKTCFCFFVFLDGVARPHAARPRQF